MGPAFVGGLGGLVLAGVTILIWETTATWWVGPAVFLFILFSLIGGAYLMHRTQGKD